VIDTAGFGFALASNWLAAYITSIVGDVPVSATQRLPLWSNAMAVLPPNGVPSVIAGAALVLDVICLAE
jgi:hypothetical protein